MNTITCASRAPGVESVGMICAAMASISAAWGAVKNANDVCPLFADCWTNA